ncbi:unnamed protein product [Hymenolepis diminuta]|uniref:Uncharacterized protein n=1 Tax=Hymenolepis diminuta TaxID=6216 RepID=A0A564YT82_HYMDI|nr:unnamed protein product [Hymenolepis diminuta]
MGREGVKVANLTCDSALIDSDSIPTRLIRKMSSSMTQFVAQSNPSARQKPFSPYPCCRG